MSETFSNYALSIVCASFLINIIHSILPNGESKKYIFFVSTMIITIILINPIISFLNKEFDLMAIFELNKKETEKIQEESYKEYYDSQLLNVYKRNLENDIIKRIEENGYKVNKIECEYDEITNEPEHLILELELYDKSIMPVKIEVSSNNTSSNKISTIDEIKIKSIIKEIYGISKIEINKN